MAKRDDLPFDLTPRVRDACLCLHIQCAARAIARRYDEALRPLGLTNGQFSLMMSMNRAAPPTIGQVSAVLAMDRTTLTANLKPLIRRGLVKVAPDPNDKRSRLMALTQAGRKLMAEAVPVWKRTQEATERLFSDPDRLRSDLRALS